MLKKLDIINDIFNKTVSVESTITSGHIITFLFKDNKSTALDFDQNYLKYLKIENIPTMLNELKLIDLVLNNNYKTISISEKGAIPYLGNK